jgi:hypothetical protein
VLTFGCSDLGNRFLVKINQKTIHFHQKSIS